MATVRGALRRVPMLDDLSFWLVANSLILAYIGAAELIFRYGPGNWYDGGAVLLAALYLILARRWFRHRPWWIVPISLATPVVVILVDLVITQGATSLSALLDIASLLLVFVAFREWRASHPVPPMPPWGPIA